MTGQLAARPATTTDVQDFDHCLQIALTLIARRQPRGTFRHPDDESCPAEPDKFVVRLEEALDDAALIGVTLYDVTLEAAFTEHLEAALPAGKQVHRIEDDGPLYIFALYPYPG